MRYPNPKEISLIMEGKVVLESMDINTPVGSKVKYMHPENTSGWDRKQAEKYLTVGNVYTIYDKQTDEFATVVQLKELPGIGFTSVLFDTLPGFLSKDPVGEREHEAKFGKGGPSILPEN